MNSNKPSIAQDPSSPTATSNQIVDYSEFLYELAKQRHTIIKRLGEASYWFTGYNESKSGAKDMLTAIDALIRDTFVHIAGNDLVGERPEVQL